MTPPRTTIAPARLNARRSSKPDRASARRSAARWTGSAPSRAPAPARNVLPPRSLLHPLRRALRGLGSAGIRLGGVIVLPVPLLLQRVRDFLGHVGLVMLGEHGVGLEHAGGVERAFGDHTLPFTEQIRKNSLVGHGHYGAAVGDLERDRQVVAAHQRPRLHEAAEPETLARLDMLFSHHRRRRKKHD